MAVTDIFAISRLREQFRCLNGGNACRFRYTKHLRKAEGHGTKLATQLGPVAGDCVTLYSTSDSLTRLRLSHVYRTLRVRLGKGKILQT